MASFSLNPLRVVPVTLAAALACSESGPRIYTAQPYRAEPGCLESYVALGVVQSGDLGARCAPVCLRLDGALYVSPVCSPYPSRATLEASSGADCAAALQAFSIGADCPPPADAATDAATDAAPGGP